MKKVFLSFAMMIMALQVMVSCSDDDDNTNEEETTEVATAEDFTALQDKAIEDRTQIFTFNAEDGWQSFTTAEGVIISINGDCLTKDGSSVSGEVELKYVELFNGADMLLTGKPTMGVDSNGDLKPLVSGGSFYVQAYQGDEKLELTCSMSLQVPTDLTDGTDYDMVLWTGEEDSDGNFVWTETADAGDAGVDVLDGELGDGGIEGEGVVYYAYFDQFGWTNVDRFYSYTGDKTQIKVAVPTGYDNDNSAVYLHYDGEGSSLAKLDVYDDTNEVFTEHYGYVPVGLATHIIFASEKNGKWLYAIKGVSIEADATYTFTESELTEATEDELKAAILALP